MNTSNISGDALIVMGSPIPTDKEVKIPPKTAGKKVIEEGEVILKLESNTPELIAKLNKSKNNEER